MSDIATKGGDVRRMVRDAMDRLLEGNPIRSDGKLTIKSLATEAGVKRWVLTHQHTDLQQEFRERCERQGETPANQQKLLDKLESMKDQVEKYKVKVSGLSEENNRLARVVQILALENLQLRERLDEQREKVRNLR